MIRKKRHVLKISRERELTEKDTEIEISWSSSDEEVSVLQSSKKSKVTDNFFETHKSNKWLNHNKNSFKSSIIDNLTKDDWGSECVCDMVNIKPSTSNNNDNDFLEDSPVVGSIKINESSPSLTQSENISDISPVIGKSNIIKRIIQSKRDIARKRVVLSEFEVTKTIEIEDDSRDLFPTQSSCVIDDIHSPEFKTQLQISQIISQNSNANEIQVVDNQSGTTTTNYAGASTTDTTCGSSSLKSSSTTLYHELRPKKKKNKKNGVAFQLQRALQNQRSNTSIWLHEHYLNKCANELLQIGDKGKIKLKINIIWKEFDCTLIYCTYIEANAIKDGEQYCLAIIGFNSIVSCKIELSSTFYLHVPYSVTRVKYKNKVLNCYYNVSRILNCC